MTTKTYTNQETVAVRSLLADGCRCVNHDTLKRLVPYGYKCTACGKVHRPREDGKWFVDVASRLHTDEDYWYDYQPFPFHSLYQAIEFAKTQVGYPKSKVRHIYAEDGTEFNLKYLDTFNSGEDRKFRRLHDTDAEVRAPWHKKGYEFTGQVILEDWYVMATGPDGVGYLHDLSYVEEIYQEEEE